MEGTKNKLETAFFETQNLNNSNISFLEKEGKKLIFRITKMTKEKMFNSQFLQSFLSKKVNFEEKDENNKIDLPDFNFEGLISVLINIKNNNSVSEFHSNFMDFKTPFKLSSSFKKTKIDIF